MILQPARDVSLLTLRCSISQLWGHARKLKFSLFSSAIYKQNVSVLLLLSDSVRCWRGYYFLAWVLYFSFGTY